jgi:hypothetical protein
MPKIIFKKGFKPSPLTSSSVGNSFLTRNVSQNQDNLKFLNVDCESSTKLSFPDIAEPTHIDDWLAQYNPISQDFNSWLEYMYTSVNQRSIGILPIGSFDDNNNNNNKNHVAPDLTVLQQYLTAFFQGIDVQMLPSATISRKNDSSSTSTSQPSFEISHTFTNRNGKEHSITFPVRSARFQSHPFTKHKYKKR